MTTSIETGPPPSGIDSSYAWMRLAVALLLGTIGSVGMWSFVVALMAGVAGTLALTTAKSGPLVGVFISVTTVPAAGTVALCVGTGVWHEIAPALAQLVVNLVGMIVAGTLTLLAQRAYWVRKGGTAAHHVHG